MYVPSPLSSACSLLLWHSHDVKEAHMLSLSRLLLTSNNLSALSLSSEFKEAFPAGRFRPVCKIQAKRGASSSVIAESVKAPEWWHSTRIIQAFDQVLQDKVRELSLNRFVIFRSAVASVPPSPWLSRVSS